MHKRFHILCRQKSVFILESDANDFLKFILYLFFKLLWSRGEIIDVHFGNILGVILLQKTIKLQY